MNRMDYDLWSLAEYVLKSKRSSDVLVHTMRIRAADAKDDGNYACILPSKAYKASQIVHVNMSESLYLLMKTRDAQKKIE